MKNRAKYGIVLTGLISITLLLSGCPKSVSGAKAVASKAAAGVVAANTASQTNAQAAQTASQAASQ